jgi:serine/threonine-protein kinase HipA
MIALQVWLRTAAGALLAAGEIRVADPDPRRGGLLRGEFRYHAGFLDHPDAVALDPLRLPLAPGVFDAGRPQAGVHACFEDSLPDAWGRGLLIRRYTLPRSQQTAPHLLAVLGAAGLRALAYTRGSAAPAPVDAGPILDLESLIEAAERYDQDPGALGDNDLGLLFRAASSPGGARPKLLIEAAGQGHIAKLASARDTVDMVRVEAACLALARDAGLAVAEFRVETFGRRAALLVRRFDQTPAGGRYHVLSLQTLMGAEGYYHLGSADLADCLRRVSARPETDLAMLYRQMVFNALIGNTDDHLKNFAMRREPAGWRLTPAYDLLPDVLLRGEHCLHFGLVGSRPSADAVGALGAAFGLSRQRTRRIIAEVVAAVVGWRARFTGYGVPAADSDRLGREIARRLAGYRSTSG